MEEFIPTSTLLGGFMISTSIVITTACLIIILAAWVNNAYDLTTAAIEAFQ